VALAGRPGQHVDQLEVEEGEMIENVVTMKITA